MDRLCDSNKCTGCLACANICRHQAICIEEKQLGFKYPKIDKNKCVGCGACSKVCHELNQLPKKEPLSCYTYCADKNERLKSSSGAFFPLIANYLLSKDYYICGVVFNDDYLGAKYIVTKSSADIERMRKSKYFEADLGQVYIEISRLLKDKQKVFFVGLPCHVAGLLKYTNNHPNLLTMDLICYGNGSAKMYQSSIMSFLNKNGHKKSDILKVDFRHKPFLNHSHTIMDLETTNNNYIIDAYDLPYYYGFIKRLLFRTACYQCRYSSFERVSDITIGDTLGQDDIYGKNVVLCNSEKAKELFSLPYFSKMVLMEEEELTWTKGRFNRDGKLPFLYNKICKEKNYEVIERKYLNKNYRCLSLKIHDKALSIYSKFLKTLRG